MTIRKRLREGFTLIELMIVVAIVGVLAVLAVYGVRKYIANAKTAEAKNSIGQMSKDAVSHYEGETMAGSVVAPGNATSVLRDVCLSASITVPAAIPAAKKYQSAQTEWNIDSATLGKGFACLKFEMAAPQYYQYNYEGVSTKNFTASARGDLNGDTTASFFHQDASIFTGALVVAPTIIEVTPEE